MKTILIILFSLFIFSINPSFGQASNDPVIIAYKLVNIGNNFFNQNKLVKAAYCYKEAVRLNPKLAGGYINLALVYYKIGDYPAFVANIKRAASLGDKQSQRILSVLAP